LNTAHFRDARQNTKPRSSSNTQPLHRGHLREGYGLSWNPHTEGRLLSGSDDGRVCMWDVGAKKGRIVEDGTIYHVRRGRERETERERRAVMASARLGSTPSVGLTDSADLFNAYVCNVNQ
jgi:WD40 repeat protein